MFLKIKEVDVFYAKSHRPAVSSASLELKAGEIGVLIGPSGCGKTTLLRAVAGLEKINGGEIRLADELVSSQSMHIAPEKRRIGMVFQDYALFPHMSVEKNIGFGLAKMDSGAKNQRIKEMLDLVDLSNAGKKYPHELSGGQQQRVALARALAPRPALMLLDEPFSNLDVDLRERLAHELRAILKNAGATALFVTHDQLEAFAIGDTIGAMNEGHLHQWDSAYKLYHQPASRFVADFIGHGVFIKANNLKDYINISKEQLENDLLIRADDISYDENSNIKAEIIRKSFRGSKFLYTLKLNTNEIVMAHVPSHYTHKVGDKIGIKIDLNHFVSFKSNLNFN